jgi:hypothetical protein
MIRHSHSFPPPSRRAATYYLTPQTRPYPHAPVTPDLATPASGRSSVAQPAGNDSASPMNLVSPPIGWEPLFPGACTRARPASPTTASVAVFGCSLCTLHVVRRRLQMGPPDGRLVLRRSLLMTHRQALAGEPAPDSRPRSVFVCVCESARLRLWLCLPVRMCVRAHVRARVCACVNVFACLLACVRASTCFTSSYASLCRSVLHRVATFRTMLQHRVAPCRRRVVLRELAFVARSPTLSYASRVESCMDARDAPAPSLPADTARSRSRLQPRPRASAKDTQQAPADPAGGRELRLGTHAFYATHGTHSTQAVVVAGGLRRPSPATPAKGTAAAGS